MANQALTLELDPANKAALQRFLKQVSEGVKDMSPFFDSVEMHMIDSITQNFEAGGRPQSWAPLRPATIAMKGSSSILQDHGDLKNSINASNTDRDALSLKLWAGEAHGAFHQQVDSDPLSQWGKKNKRGMPFRPFILFQDSDLTEIENILIKYIDHVGGF